METKIVKRYKDPGGALRPAEDRLPGSYNCANFCTPMSAVVCTIVLAVERLSAVEGSSVGVDTTATFVSSVPLAGRPDRRSR